MNIILSSYLCACINQLGPQLVAGEPKEQTERSSHRRHEGVDVGELDLLVVVHRVAVVLDLQENRPERFAILG